MYIELHGRPTLDFLRYSPRGGLRCPSCGSPMVVVRRTLPWYRATVPPLRVRYHACRDCGERFKSVEA